MPKKAPSFSESPVWSHQRIGGLVDGVFAIAMTLLVFNLRVPVVPEGSPAGALGTELRAQLPQFLSLGLSLSVLGVYWVAYTILFHLVRRTDRLYHWVNLLFVLFIVCVPFCANLIAQYPQRLEAVLLYGSVLVGGSLALYLNVWYVQRFDLLGPQAHPSAVAALKRRILQGTAVYVLATLLAFIDTRISLSVYVLISLFYVFPPKTDRYLSR
jgi:uncharacterized membrane protein